MQNRSQPGFYFDHLHLHFCIASKLTSVLHSQGSSHWKSGMESASALLWVRLSAPQIVSFFVALTLIVALVLLCMTVEFYELEEHSNAKENKKDAADVDRVWTARLWFVAWGQASMTETSKAVSLCIHLNTTLKWRSSGLILRSNCSINLLCHRLHWNLQRTHFGIVFENSLLRSDRF